MRVALGLGLVLVGLVGCQRGPERGTFVVEVVDEAGTPLPGTHVHCVPYGVYDRDRGRWVYVDGVSENLQTDDEGVARFELVANVEHTLSVQRIGTTLDHHSERIPAFAPGEHRAERVVLVDVPWIEVPIQVVDAATGEPLASARVTERSGVRWERSAVDPPPSPVEREFEVSADGRTTLRHRASRPHLLAATAYAVEAPGYTPATFGQVRRSSEREGGRTVPLLRAATLVLELRHAGAPLSGARVEVQSDGRAFDRTLDGPSQSDLVLEPLVGESGVDGRVTLSDVPAHSPLTIWIESEHGSLELPRPLMLEPGESRRHAVDLADRSVIEGFAREVDGPPAAGLDLCLVALDVPWCSVIGEGIDAWQERRSGADGRFRFDGVPVGTYAIGPRVSTPRELSRSVVGEWAATPTIVEVVPGADAIEVQLDAHRGHTRGGVLETPDQRRFGGGIVYATRDEEPRWASAAEVLEAGPFRIGPFIPGSYTLRVLDSPFVLREPLRFEIGSGEPETLVVRLAEGTDLDVDVRTGGGPPVAHATCDAYGPSRRVATMHERELVLEGLADGAHDLVVRTSDGRVGVAPGVEVDRRRTGTVVEVTVSAGAWLHVVRRSAQPYADVEVHHGGAQVARFGTERFRPHTVLVPAGTLRIDFEVDGTVVETRTVELAPGDEREVAF